MNNLDYPAGADAPWAPWNEKKDDKEYIKYCPECDSEMINHFKTYECSNFICNNTINKFMETESKDVVVREKSALIIMADIENGELPDLENAEEYPVDLLSEYWTPESYGEKKNLYFAKFDSRSVVDDKGEIKLLETAYFIEKKNGVAKSVANASKRLVGALQDANVKPGMAVSITYLGKQRNKTNQYQSDNWSIKPLMTKAC